MEQRRINQRLSTLFKMINNEIDVNHDRYIKPKVNRSRRSHNKQYETTHHTSAPHTQSFFVETVKHWNALPNQVVNSSSIKYFKESIKTTYESPRN